MQRPKEASSMTTRSAKSKPAAPKRIPTLTSAELFLVRQYAREGGTEDKLARAARRAKMTEQLARTLLKKPHVQHELALYTQILRQEQAKIDAKDIDRRDQEDDRLLSDLERKAIRKMGTLIEADPKTLMDQHRIQMQVLKLALVVTGTIRDGRTERLTPAEITPPQGMAQSPGSFFGRGMVSAEEAAPLYGAASHPDNHPDPETTHPQGNAPHREEEDHVSEGPLEVTVAPAKAKRSS